jgi:hypothetical protein
MWFAISRPLCWANGEVNDMIQYQKEKKGALIQEQESKFASSTQEKKTKSAAEIVGPELHSKTQGNIKLEAHANKIKPLMNIGLDNIRFQRGCEIASKKNQIEELDRSRYSVKSQSNCGEYNVLFTEIGWICSCADYKFRNVTCKHIFSILWILNIEQEIESMVAILE